MASVERQIGQPERSLWNSRVFKVGVTLMALGLITANGVVFSIGGAMASGAWAMTK